MMAGKIILVVSAFLGLILIAKANRTGCDEMTKCFRAIQPKVEECSTQVKSRATEIVSDTDNPNCMKRLWTTVKELTSRGFQHERKILHCISEKMAKNLLTPLSDKMTGRCKTILSNPNGVKPLAKVQKIGSIVTKFLAKIMPDSPNIRQCISEMVKEKMKCLPFVSCCPTVKSCHKELQLPSAAKKFGQIVSQMKQFTDCRTRYKDV